jgi:hypothetical protein
MKKNFIYLIFLAIIILLQFNINYYSKSVTISPDSIRFMSFWQNNYDLYHNNLIKFIYHSLKDSIKYDYNRARITQYLLYGIDVIIRKGGVNYDTNYIMLFLMYLNSFLVSIYFTKNIKIESEKILIFILTIGICCSSIYFYSSILVVILYAKHVWITFILLYFISKIKIIQYSSLLFASFSDELGLISSLIIIFLIVYSYLQEHNFSLKKSLFVSFSIISILFLAFFGFSAIVFNLGSGFASMSINFGAENIRISFFEKIASISEIFTNIILGSNLFLNDNSRIFIKILLILIISIVLIIIIVKQNFLKIIYNFKYNLINPSFINKNLFLYFTFSIFIIINFIILPGGGNDFGHRGYARYISILLLFLSILFSFISISKIKYILFFIFCIHFLVFTFSKDNQYNFNNKMLNVFIVDSSISIDDLNKINISRDEFVNTGKSNTFNEINNNELIDLSGTWYYSKIKNFDTTKGSYFPVKGTLEVMIWPKKITNIK